MFIEHKLYNTNSPKKVLDCEGAEMKSGKRHTIAVV